MGSKSARAGNRPYLRIRRLQVRILPGAPVRPQPPAPLVAGPNQVAVGAPHVARVHFTPDGGHGVTASRQRRHVSTLGTAVPVIEGQHSDVRRSAVDAGVPPQEGHEPLPCVRDGTRPAAFRLLDVVGAVVAIVSPSVRPSALKADAPSSWQGCVLATTLGATRWGAGGHASILELGADISPGEPVRTQQPPASPVHTPASLR